MRADSPTPLALYPLERLCIDVTGSDAATYLHSQLSNDIASMEIGDSRYSFVLEPTGRIVALVRVSRRSRDSYLIDTDASDDFSDLLLSRLNRFKIRVDVDFQKDVRQCVAVRSFHGVLHDSIRAAVNDVPSRIAVPAWWADGCSMDVLPLTGDLDPVAIAMHVGGAVVEDAEEFEIARVRAGWPAMGSEIQPGETLVAATGLASLAVSFTKGCYPGQELVERMDSRGSSAPRLLRRFVRGDAPFEDWDQLRPGDPLIADSVEIGTVTSIAGDWLLAYVARGIDAGTPVNPGG